MCVPIIQEDYIAVELKKHDFEKFLCTLFVSAEHRVSVQATLLFAHEIFKIPHVTTDDMTALIRYKWWHEAVGEIYDGKNLREHYLILPLKNAAAKYDITRKLFDDFLLENQLAKPAPENLYKIIEKILGEGAAFFKKLEITDSHQGGRVRLMLKLLFN